MKVNGRDGGLLLLLPPSRPNARMLAAARGLSSALAQPPGRTLPSPLPHVSAPTHTCPQVHFEGLLSPVSPQISNFVHVASSLDNPPTNAPVTPSGPDRCAECGA